MVRAGQELPAPRSSAERSERLEEVTRWILEALESAAAFGHVQSRLRSDRDPGTVFLAARPQLRRLLNFGVVAFLTVSERSDFVLADCDPDGDRARVQADVEAAISQGLFAWAVNQNRVVTAPSVYPGHTLVLHSLVAGSQVVGMFAGRVPDGECDLTPPRSSLLSLILLNTAQAFENATLYQRIQTHARTLEQSVEQACEELSRTKDHLAQAQKIEAVGRLAGGIAHDFNNLLTVITGHVQLLRDGVRPDDPLRRHAEAIRQSAGRAAALTRQLLAFSRKQVLQPKVLDLNVAVRNMEGMLRRLIGEHIELVTACEPTAGRVMADLSQLEQAIMNLVVNARDAMPDGGRLTLATSNAELDAAFARDHPGARAGACVRLEVSDTGVGMDAEVRAHLFEPFFTTKEVGKGTGLGLATVYGIVQQSGGYIWVDSEPGGGSRFTIYLPRVAGEADLVGAPDDARAVPRGAGTILVVEDEQPVRTLVCEMLELSGYSVLAASHGVEALELVERHGGPVDLVLTDVVMPRMGGRQLADRLATVRPEAKVLFMSGYTDDALGFHGFAVPGAAFVQKPFSADALAHAVRAVLEAR